MVSIGMVYTLVAFVCLVFILSLLFPWQPTVSLELMLKCEPLTLLLHKLEKIKKYKYSHLSDDAIHFKMVTSNVSIVIHMLDEVRKNKRCVLCVRDNKPGI